MTRPEQYIDLDNKGRLNFFWPYNPGMTDIVRSYVAWCFWDKSATCWTAPVTPPNLEGVQTLAPEWGFTYSDRVKHLFKVSAQQIALRARIAGYTDIESITERLQRSLLPFQREGVDLILKRQRVLLADAMGLGKTTQALAAIEQVESFPAVVVVPSGYEMIWETEIRTILPHRPVYVVGRKENKDATDGFLIASLNGLGKHLFWLQAQMPLALIVDEAHKIKNTRTEGFKNVRKLAHFCAIKILITGTPLLNRPKEMLAPLIVLDSLDRDFGGWDAFVSRYCDLKIRKFGTKEIKDSRGHSNLQELNEKLLETVMIRRLKSQVLHQLPVKNRVAEVVELTNYDRYLATLRAIHPRAKHGEYGIKLTDQLRKISAEGKLASVYAWADALLAQGEKVLLAGFHVDILREVAARYGCALLDGSMKKIERKDAVDRFQHTAGAAILVMNYQVGGQGFTITGCQHLGFIEFDIVPGNNDQVEDRIHRIGQQHDVHIRYFVGARTIDVSWFDMAVVKRQISEEAIDRQCLDAFQLFDLIDKDINLSDAA